jgi:hypothetical protein
MRHFLYHARRLTLSYMAEWLLRSFAWQQQFRRVSVASQDTFSPVSNPTRPEDVNPLTRGNIEHPYAYYRLLRDQRPVYKPEGADFYCISRY